jgi:uncharacterized membrane protein YdjX (TVP38/TMEM64 family)
MAGLLLAVLVGVVVLVGTSRETWQWLVAHEQWLRWLLVSRHPYWGFLGGFVGFTLLSLVPGFAGKSLVMGWLFGFWRSLAIVNIGLTLAAVAELLFSRYFIRDAIESRFGYYLQKANQALERDGPWYVLAMRLAHTPYTLTNLLIGATSMSTGGFWWATQLGMLPGNIVFCYAGAQLPTLEDIARGGAHRAFSPSLLLAFVLLGIFPLLARWLVRKLRGPSAVTEEV